MSSPDFLHAFDPIFNELLSPIPSRAQKRKMDIIEKAISLYAQMGQDGLTYENLGKHCGVSRPLVQHYFPNREELFRLVFKLVQSRRETHWSKAIAVGGSAPLRLEVIIDAEFRWIAQSRNEAVFWLFAQYRSASDPHFNGLCEEIETRRHKILFLLLKEGRNSSDFTTDDPSGDAGYILQILHSARTQALGLPTSENGAIDQEALRDLHSQTLDTVRMIAGH